MRGRGRYFDGTARTPNSLGAGEFEKFLGGDRTRNTETRGYGEQINKGL
jgi:hypothetical protein